jgi:hypothetical protein
MQLDLRQARNDTELGGLGGADDSDSPGFHAMPRITGCRQA